MLKPEDLVDEVRAILAAADEPGGTRDFMTPYQLLQALSVKERLVRECSRGVAGPDAIHAAAGFVREALALPGLREALEVETLDSGGIVIEVDDVALSPRRDAIAIYRLRRVE